MQKRIFITGGAHGIGRGLVSTFAREGWQVAFCDVDDALAQTTATETGARYFHVDVTDASALEHCMEQLFLEWGDLDVIINNCGIGIFKPITQITLDEFDLQLATNLRPAFITARRLALHRQQQGGMGGRIINLCSTRYLMSEPGTEGYSASKGGIYSLTHALAISLAPYQITVNAIAPGWIHVQDDEVLRPIDHQFHPSGRVGTTDDIARAALYLCQEGNDFINGQTLVIDGGVTRKMIYPE